MKLVREIAQKHERDVAETWPGQYLVEAETRTLSLSLSLKRIGRLHSQIGRDKGGRVPVAGRKDAEAAGEQDHDAHEKCRVRGVDW